MKRVMTAERANFTDFEIRRKLTKIATTIIFYAVVIRKVVRERLSKDPKSLQRDYKTSRDILVTLGFLRMKFIV